VAAGHGRYCCLFHSQRKGSARPFRQSPPQTVADSMEEGGEVSDGAVKLVEGGGGDLEVTHFLYFFRSFYTPIKLLKTQVKY
jgi:hypothetical protein